MTGNAPSRPAFDAVADGYDARFTQQPIARHLRDQVLQTVLAYLPDSNGRVLEVGCGTGEDAKTLAGNGHAVLATDAAPNMLRQADGKAGTPPAFQTALWRVGDPPPADVQDAAPFDMVFSNFGAVNCIKDIGGFGQECAQLTRRGGYVALVLINRWCLMEILLGVFRLNPGLASRRFRQKRQTRLEDGTPLEVQFPSVRGLATDMGDAFDIVACYPVGVFLPPSEYYVAFQKRPRLLRPVMWLDRQFGPLWPLSRLGDHVLVVFQRKGQQ